MTDPIDIRRRRPLRDLLITADPHHVKVEVKGHKLMTPEAARVVAVELFYAADEAEGNETIGDFGYAPDDSRKLGELYLLIDECIGWESDEQERDGDYRARIQQVGRLLKRRLRLVKP